MLHQLILLLTTVVEVTLLPTHPGFVLQLGAFPSHVWGRKCGSFVWHFGATICFVACPWRVWKQNITSECDDLKWYKRIVQHLMHSCMNTCLTVSRLKTVKWRGCGVKCHLDNRIAVSVVYFQHRKIWLFSRIWRWKGIGFNTACKDEWGKIEEILHNLYPI